MSLLGCATLSANLASLMNNDRMHSEVKAEVAGALWSLSEACDIKKSIAKVAHRLLTACLVAHRLLAAALITPSCPAHLQLYTRLCVFTPDLM